MTVPNLLDEVYQYPAQDPHDPVWAPDAEIEGMRQVDDPNDMFDTRQPVTIRKADGAQDFLNDVTERLGEIVGVTAHEPRPKKKMKLDVIATKEMGSDKWRGGNATVGITPVKVVTESAQRRRVEIRNRVSGVAVGNGRVYLSSLPSQANAPNTIELDFDALNPEACRVVLYTKDDVYAICAAGDGAILDIIEEFDLEC